MIYRSYNPSKPMEEKREKKTQPKSSSTMANSVAFSDEIPNMNTSSTFSFPFSSPSLSSFFDMMPPPPPQPCDDQKASSFGGFVDLLGLHDYNPSLFDWLPTTTTTVATAAQINHPLPSPASSNVPDCSEVLNAPASPNSSSISSSSNEAAVANKAANEHEVEDEDGDGDAGRGDDQDHDKTKKQ